MFSIVVTAVIYDFHNLLGVSPEATTVSNSILFLTLNTCYSATKQTVVTDELSHSTLVHRPKFRSPISSVTVLRGRPVDLASSSTVNVVSQQESRVKVTLTELSDRTCVNVH